MEAQSRVEKGALSVRARAAMDFMLVIIAIAIFCLTVVMNGVVMVHFSDEQDKNQAWLPKLVV